MTLVRKVHAAHKAQVAVLLAVLLALVASPAMSADPGGPAPRRDETYRVSNLSVRPRTHCRIDALSGREICPNRCGSGYEFFACSSQSFGCCHADAGYCDFDQHLRCAPPLFVFSSPTW